MIQERRHRLQGQFVRVTDETKAHMRYVMGALKLNQGELAARLGLTGAVVSRILAGSQKQTTMDSATTYYPRLTKLIEQADRGRGEGYYVRDPEVKAINPVSTPEAKEFVLGPYREKVQEKSANFDKRRENHRAAMKAYWARRKAQAQQVAAVPDRVEVDTAPMAREGFFQKVWNSIRTGFNAVQ